MKGFFVRRWFLVALLLVLGVGFCCSARLAPALKGLPSDWRSWWVAGVMFFMALPLDASAMWRAMRRPGATLLAVAMNFLAVPAVAWAISPLLLALSRDLGFGLLIAAAVPSTVASAAVWTRRAGGNDAVALMVTMVTNLGCFLVTPMILLLTAGTRIESGSLDPIPMMQRLSLVVVVPVLAAQLLRMSKPLGRWAERQKTALGVVCQLGMLTMVFAGVVRSGDVLDGVGGPRPGPHVWLAMIGCVLLVHLTTLWAGYLLAGVLGMAREDRIAVGFSGSQKTLLVGLSIALDYAAVFGQLALLPMVAYHVSQLLTDTIIADRLRRRGA